MRRSLIGFDYLEYVQEGDSDGEESGIDHLVIGWRDGSTHEIACTEDAPLAKLFAASPELHDACDSILTALRFLRDSKPAEYDALLHGNVEFPNAWDKCKLALVKSQGFPLQSESQSEGNSNTDTVNSNVISPLNENKEGGE